MADDPADPPTLRSPRARTAPGVGRDRDELSQAARADRSPLVPEFVSEDVTGQVMAMSDDDLAGDMSADDPATAREEMLAEMRDTRSPKTRIRHLERKMDKIVPDLAHIKGTLEVLPGYVKDAAAAAREAAAAANAVANAHRVATLTATLETDGAAAVGAIQVHTAEKVEKVEKRKTWRELALTAGKIIAGIAGAGGIADLIHRLGGG